MNAHHPLTAERMTLIPTLINSAMGLRKTAHHHWREAREYEAMGRNDRAASHRRSAANCIGTARFNLRWARSRMARQIITDERAAA